MGGPGRPIKGCGTQSRVQTYNIHLYAPGEETQAELRQELEKAMVALERRVNAVDSEVRQAKPVLVVGKPGKRGPRGKPGTLPLLLLQLLLLLLLYPYSRQSHVTRFVHVPLTACVTRLSATHTYRGQQCAILLLVGITTHSAVVVHKRE